ncbi:MAG TPA: SIS domain-containing protein [Acidisoma sp.]|uniref:SIS domain-containing protein n=1 Tax=Acidisoma sp. TaxID=1872115 RepID=UPI002C75EF7F|nr:SIS domain-containing protein [Acidisoma sp.]HTI01594.1 SIS domain-containing protein [Acidisoma sp.]
MKIAAYIREQPAILAQLPGLVAPRLAEIGALQRKPERLVLLGTGSSMNALLAAGPALEEATGAALSFKEPEAFLRYPPRADGGPALVLAVSQSGRSTTTVEAVRQAVGLGLPTVAVIGDPGSPMEQTGAEIVMMPIGEEKAGPKTKGYTGSVLTLLAIAGQLGGSTLELAGLEGDINTAVTQSEAAARALVQKLGVPDYIQVIGQFGHVGSAIEGALKIAEITGIPTSGLDIEEALHGHAYGTNAGSLLMVIARDAREAAVAANLAEGLTPLGPRVVIVNLSEEKTDFDLAITFPKTKNGWVDTTWALFPFQWMALHLSDAKGIADPGMIYPTLGKKLNVKIRDKA